MDNPPLSPPQTAKPRNFELFISYARKDNEPQHPDDTRGWVSDLHDETLVDWARFSTEPLRVFFDTDAIQGMDDWRHRILEGLRYSRILLICLSPNYFASDYCRWEWEEYSHRQIHHLIGQESIAPVYFVEVPGAEEGTHTGTLRAWMEDAFRPHCHCDFRPWFPQGTGSLRDEAVRRRIAALGISLWRRIQRARRAHSIPGNLRRRNPHFVGRKSELRQLHENLALGAVGVVTAVHGLGGQGKTELLPLIGRKNSSSSPLPWSNSPQSSARPWIIQPSCPRIPFPGPGCSIWWNLIFPRPSSMRRAIPTPGRTFSTASPACACLRPATIRRSSACTAWLAPTSGAG